MYFCYIDESGHCGMKYDTNQPVEVLVGVVSDASKVHKTTREHKNYLRWLLREHGVNVPEIKASHLFRGKKEWYTINADTRKEILGKLLSWIKGRNCKLIVCPIDSKKFFELKESSHPIAQKLKYPYEAGGLNILLGLQRYKYGTKNNKGKTVVIFDEQKEHDKNLISLVSGDLSFTDNFTGFKISKSRKGATTEERFCQIIDIPFFSKSEHSELIQIADIVAFVVARYIQLKSFSLRESFPGEKSFIEHLYKSIASMLIPSKHINPSVKDDALCQFYAQIRPPGWSAKTWIIK